MTGILTVRNAGSRGMWVRDTGQKGSLRGAGGRLLVLDIVIYDAVSQLPQDASDVRSLKLQ